MYNKIMQTFLPYKDFRKTARSLDDKRLFKQLVEARQIINLITTGKTKSGRKYRGFINHPARFMWEGYPDSLKNYANEILKEIQIRGRTKTSMRLLRTQKIKNPKWLGNEKFHASHRASLLAKDYEHYKQFNWKEKPKIDYIWPKNN
ncbi:MAG: pyrimidine dimer DNA glycosylase/endonuclease V [Patescibacteria group bacterium]